MNPMNACCTVRANANTQDEAQMGVLAGAEGVGLYRTEAMLLTPSRLPAMRTMMVAKGSREREVAINALLPLHQLDFEQLFRVVAPLPLTIQLLNPALQDVMPTAQQLELDLATARSEENWDEYVALESLGQYCSGPHQANPSIGHRGGRLLLTDSDFIRLQVRAILQAAIKLSAEGISTVPEMMVPCIASELEMRAVAMLISETAAEVYAVSGKTIRYKLGALIELPRAALCAAAIAEHVDFISFDTNDLTEMTFGFSRQDARLCIDAYLAKGTLKQDPFLCFDQEGVGQLMEMAIRDIRQIYPSVAVGICGDHANDLVSLRYFHSLSVDYLSCAPDWITKTKQRLEAADDSILA